MRIFGLLVGHFVVLDFASLRVELTDVMSKVSCKPDIARRIGNQAVRTRVVHLQGKFLERATSRIEPSDFVLHLFGEPQRTVHADGGIVGMRPSGWHIPLLDADLQLANTAPGFFGSAGVCAGGFSICCMGTIYRALFVSRRRAR